jgi:UDP-N-acetylmuramate dehydrogenase
MDLRQSVPLKDFSNYKIGGPAKLFVEVSSREELIEVLGKAKEIKNIFVLGGGTNVLIDDKGFDGLVIHNKILGIDREEENLIVGSGVMVKDVLEYCIDSELSGLEWAGGLPGTVGGAVRGNAGAFKGEMKDSVLTVESINTEDIKTLIRSNEECNFDYRNSVFKSEKGIHEFVTYVKLSLKKGDREDIKQKIQVKIDYRRNRHPMEHPNIGSIFKNIPYESLSNNLKEEFKEFVKVDPFAVVPVTKLLALSGLKGKKEGGAMISDKHPNFIVNIDNASSEDVKALIGIAKQAVLDKYGLYLEEEIMHL